MGIPSVILHPEFLSLNQRVYHRKSLRRNCRCNILVVRFLVEGRTTRIPRLFLLFLILSVGTSIVFFWLVCSRFPTLKCIIIH